jgi:hypothetical protein
VIFPEHVISVFGTCIICLVEFGRGKEFVKDHDCMQPKNAAKMISILLVDLKHCVSELRAVNEDQYTIRTVGQPGSSSDILVIVLGE